MSADNNHPVTPYISTNRLPASLSTAVRSEDAGVTITIPLTITIRLGSPGSIEIPPEQSVEPVTRFDFTEAVSIDPDYSSRAGYAPDFLGSGNRRVPLPKLSADQESRASRLLTPRAGESPFELKYHHFSVVMNGQRRLAYFTAVNIDGKKANAIRRETDRWILDPRIRREEQAGENLYASNPFDRGHLVRRLDPAWGDTFGIAKVANDDTFHFTNCSPQHEDFNQGKKLWAGLEDFLLNKAVDEQKRMTVFTGPIFLADDPEYRGVKIPRRYWKVAVVPRPNGKLATLGFIVSQESLVRSVVREAAVDVARTFQTSIGDIERLTGLDFGQLRNLQAPSVHQFDLRGEAALRELQSLDDILMQDASEVGGPQAFGVGMPNRGLVAVEGTDLQYYLVNYDEKSGERTDGPGGRVSDHVLNALKQESVTDVVLFSHGWQGDVPAALEQYEKWIQGMARQQADRAFMRQRRPNFKPLLVGIHWPSLPWGNERLDRLAFSPSDEGTETLVSSYAGRLGDTPKVRELVREAVVVARTEIAGDRLPSRLEKAYRELAEELQLQGEGGGGDPGAERDIFDPEAIYQDARNLPPSGAVSFGLFSGETLLAPLRTLSFWKMKDRGRLIGEKGVHPFLRQILEVTSGGEVRVHLVGHSFGCIVIAAAVAGPPGSSSLPRPVDSMVFLQGALSLWAFCSRISHIGNRPGYFNRLFAENRVRGVTLTSRSSHDRAVGTWYPMGAKVARQVDFASNDFPRYGAVGAFGIRGPGINLVEGTLGPVGHSYSFTSGNIYNLEASDYIAQGGGFSGAHSDIHGDEVAHAVWSAWMQ